MKKQPAILVLIMIVVTTVCALSLGNTGYSQQQGESSILDVIDVKNTNLTLGKPFYTEKFEFPISQNSGDSENNSASARSVYSFEGNGILDNLQITASGRGNEVSREDGTDFLTGRALFTSSQNGTASYSFEAITNTTDEGMRISLGAAFFDANATGNLESLKSIVGVYESYIDEGQGKGIFAMWHIKDLLPK
ncbi:hypothetical protein [Candidatus Nitrosocosmicus arcticus]|uniref:Uncharacterized protein n=1 Tax=Candidatus Nitrosocosmicus arcticus TaxID=2035267 RepID=A0A557SZ06_9ARCH|nr:hypothetical protein [Candidatus Nitrosocosmicus arcticus]TVP41839.1 exported protein of unknown function [Candidatus Nitrosocosmicus arcticus]